MKTSPDQKQVTICICTYKRPEWLARLLNDLQRQETGGLFSFSIVVADNDRLESARSVVSEFAAASHIPATYCVEARQSIALARNKALQHATGDFIAFIDDDEIPEREWLLNLFKTCVEYDVAGVLGPVTRRFAEPPPQWIAKSKFYVRPTHRTGFVMGWPECRTGNLLFRRKILEHSPRPFRPEFRAGEDQDFFRRMIAEGHRFIWCDEAVVYELVPPFRWRRSVMLRRALLRGATAVLHPTFGAVDIAKSLIAVPVYTVALPFAFVFGQHRFMDLLVRLFDHLGKLLELVGLNPVKEPYVTE